MPPLIKQIKPDDVSLEEEWIRDVDYNDPGGAGATKRPTAEGGFAWSVYVDAAELVVEDPLEAALRTAVEAALRAVPGVTGVQADPENREIWFVAGTPKGEALVGALAAAVDALADRIRAYAES